MVRPALERGSPPTATITTAVAAAIAATAAAATSATAAAATATITVIIITVRRIVGEVTTRRCKGGAASRAARVRDAMFPIGALRRARTQGVLGLDMSCRRPVLATEDVAICSTMMPGPGTIVVWARTRAARISRREFGATLVAERARLLGGGVHVHVPPYVAPQIRVPHDPKLVGRPRHPGFDWCVTLRSALAWATRSAFAWGSR